MRCNTHLGSGCFQRLLTTVECRPCFKLRIGGTFHGGGLRVAVRGSTCRTDVYLVHDNMWVTTRLSLVPPTSWTRCDFSTIRVLRQRSRGGAAAMSG